MKIEEKQNEQLRKTPVSCSADPIEKKLIDDGYVEGKKSFEYFTKEIGENFNWEKVHKAMKALDWVWYFGKDKLGKDQMGIPDIPTLKNSAYLLLKESYEDGLTHGLGGFSAGWEDGEMFLAFTLEDYCT